MFRRIALAAWVLGPTLAFGGRTETLFNRDFRFRFGEAAPAVAADPALDDADWDATGLPHSFSIPYFLSPRFPVGEGWYRKRFVAPAGFADGSRVRLDFEAAFQHAEVYVNGRIAGTHDGGYTGFSVDITPHLRPGDNTLAVRVDNRWRATLPPRAGEHVFSGGLYRDVRLVVTDALHVPRNGLRVTTPEVTADAATVRATVRVKNAGDRERRFSLRAELRSPQGAVIARTETPATLAAGAEARLTLPDLAVASPALWHPDHPHLYRTEITLVEDGKTVDSVASRTGLRHFRFDKDAGFFLNGEHLPLRGANRHQDHAGWGDAVADTGHRRDAALIKACGMNFVRGSHYPHDPAFLDACDELGLLVWSENTFWGIGGFGPDGDWSCSAYPPAAADQPAFEANDRRLLGEMIDDHFNHPSIIVWSLCNEPFFTAKPALDKARAHIAAQVDEAHRLDPTRPVGVGGAQRAGFDKYGDIIGYNGDGARFPKPDRPSLVAEYGSHVDRRPGVYDPTWGETDGKIPVWRAGHALWCAFHHGSIAGDMGRMGMIDHARLPLRQWYWYRNAYANLPPPAWPTADRAVALKLEADRNALTADGSEDAHLVVTVLGANGRRVSATPDVRLEIASGPGELPTGDAIVFRRQGPAEILDGAAAIAFRSWHAGKTRLRATSPGLQPAEIEITTTGEVAWKPELRTTRRTPVAVGAPTVPRPVRAENLARSRPTRVSSVAPDSRAEFANDDDPATGWRAAAGDTTPTWRLDLENFYAVEKIHLRFGDTAPRAYRIAVSENETDWTTVAEVTGNTGDRATHAPAGKPRARFLRLLFTGSPGALAEVTVSGEPNP